MKQIIEDRRALHRIPEIDRELELTMAYLRGALKPLRCRLFSPIPDSLCAYFDNGGTHSYAFRSGCDALPLHERSFLPFSSIIPGQMHACGHDGHMAMLLELARRMNERSAEANILLIFQPAEETTGGARDICKSGVFEAHRVDAIFGLHLWPDLPLGVIASREREIMSQSCEVSVRISGRGCSAVKAEEGVDALRAGMEFYMRSARIQGEIGAEGECMLHFGKFRSGNACNTVSDHARIEGTLRAFNGGAFDEALEKLTACAKEVSKESRCKIDIETSMGYPAVVNPPRLYRRVLDSGLSFERLAHPVMTTEDFSWYQQHLPGMFFFLGTGPSPELQADDFDFDESVLEIGADFLEKLALQLR